MTHNPERQQLNAKLALLRDTELYHKQELKSVCEEIKSIEGALKRINDKSQLELDL